MKYILAVFLMLASTIATAEDFRTILPNDKVLGKITAPVTFIEYGSMTCGHCSVFHDEVFEKLKKDYIDTGKVVYAFRPFPLDDLAFAVSKLAYCAGDDSFYNFVGAFYKSQRQWTRAEDKLQAIQGIARLGGMSADTVKSCIKDTKVQKEVQYFKNSGITLGINSTPSFFVNGQIHRGRTSYEMVKGLVEKALLK